MPHYLECELHARDQKYLQKKCRSVACSRTSCVSWLVKVAAGGEDCAEDCADGGEDCADGGEGD